MTHYTVNYSIEGFESSKLIRGENTTQARDRFITLVVELGGLEESDIEYIDIVPV